MKAIKKAKEELFTLIKEKKEEKGTEETNEAEDEDEEEPYLAKLKAASGQKRKAW